MAKKRDTQPGTPPARGEEGLSRREFFKKGAVAGVGAAVVATLGTAKSQGAMPGAEVEWDYEADIVILGAGAVGLPAAIRARDLGASVIVVEQNFDVGGKMLHSAGRVSLGGGDAIQRRDMAGESDPDGFVTVDPLEEPAALEDDPDLLFRDMTDWSVVDAAGIPRYRYNDPELHRNWANHTVEVRDFLMSNHVRFSRINATHPGGGLSRARRSNVIFKIGDVTDPVAGTITREDAGSSQHTSHYAPSSMADMTNEAGPDTVRNGTAIARPLEYSARAKGAQFMLNRHMDEIIREGPHSGRVLGVKASYSPRMDPDTGERLESYWQDGNIDERREIVHIRARKAVIIGTGGHNGNPEFRSMFYPAWRNPFIAAAATTLLGRGADASGMIAGMRIGAALAGMQQNINYPSFGPRFDNVIGTSDPYTQMMPGHPVFPFRRSAGIAIGGGGYQHLIAVNQVGKRFYNETWLTRRISHPTFPGGPQVGTRSWSEHVQGDWRNCTVEFVKENFNQAAPGADAALAVNEGSPQNDYLPGPVWAIFDQAAVDRGEWNIDPPRTADNGYFFRADTIEELAERILAGSEHQNVPLMYLAETVDGWNAAADAGIDEDFERDVLHRIDTPPFYAASMVLSWLDSYGGLRINGRAQVIDTQGEAIPGLYAGGEASGGGEQHGLGRANVHGYIAATNAVEEPALAAVRVTTLAV